VKNKIVKMRALQAQLLARWDEEELRIVYRSHARANGWDTAMADSLPRHVLEGAYLDITLPLPGVPEMKDPAANWPQALRTWSPDWSDSDERLYQAARMCAGLELPRCAVCNKPHNNQRARRLGTCAPCRRRRGQARAHSVLVESRGSA